MILILCFGDLDDRLAVGAGLLVKLNDYSLHFG